MAQDDKIPHVCFECGQTIYPGSSYFYSQIDQDFYHELCWQKVVEQEKNEENKLKAEIAIVERKILDEIYVAHRAQGTPTDEVVRLSNETWEHMNTIRSFLMWVPLEILEKYNRTP